MHRRFTPTGDPSIMSITNKILAARTSLLWDHAFFGALAVQLELVDATDDPRIDTMATDGKRLYYHEPWVDGLTKEELVFVMAHEVMHNALEHHIRRQARDAGLWNKSADFAINGELVEYEKAMQCEGKRAGWKMPKDGLISDRFTGLSAEEIYRLLEEDEQKGGGGQRGGAVPGAGQGSDPGGCGGVIDACNPHDATAVAEARADVQRQIRQAASMARGANAGSLPAGVQRLIDRLVAPVVDWRQVLRRFIDDSSRKDYTWTRPNRRLLSRGLILPGLQSDGINHLVVAVDTSGSIDEEILVSFASEINAAFGDGNVDKISVIYIDTKVHRVEEFEAGDELDLRPEGGGGTAFSDGFRWINENAEDASAVVFFSDLFVTDFGEEPPMPVLWAVHGDRRTFDKLASNVPFGECVSLAA